MDKNAIKNFAIWARNKLIESVSYQAGLMGVTAEEIKAPLPQSTKSAEFYDIGTEEPYAITGEAITQRAQLVDQIRQKEQKAGYADAYKFVMEQVAYTWFNRLIAVRFMEVNDYLPSRIRVLSSESGKLEPDIVTNPFDAELDYTPAEEAHIRELKQNNRTDELFRLLFIKQCNALNEVLPYLFERTSDYTELLLSLSVVDRDGVIYHLVHDIPEESFDVEKEGQVEIIGWLYQYYNTELKDETFALLKKNKKITKERIPSATQLFTPDWIVRYMVENSLGRLWVEGHPNEELKNNWKYYLEEAEQEPEVQKQLAEIRKEYAALRPEEIKVIDPCMGSGHILVYLFEVLMQIYESQGWEKRKAARSILENNLFGLDIDERASQLAYFSVMMKAREYDRRILTQGIRPHVYAIRDSNFIPRASLKYFGHSMSELERNNARTQIEGIKDALKNATEYGSILTIEPCDWDLLERFLSEINVEGQLDFDAKTLSQDQERFLDMIHVARILSEQYHVVVTNPPYMGSSGMNAVLTEFVKKNYPDSKADMFAVFIERGFQMLKENGYESMITMESWMFLSSFEKLRTKLMQGKTIKTLVHMPYLGKGGTSLGINFGTDMAVIQNHHVKGFAGTYDRIAYYETDEGGIPFEFPVKNEYFKQTTQDNFSQIPGAPVAYWVSEAFLKTFNNKKIDDFASTNNGFTTGDNNLFLRLWFEVAQTNICFNNPNIVQVKNVSEKWFPYNKGGDYRKWYGNNDYLINYGCDGKDLKNYGHLVPRSLKYQFFESGTWNKITSGTTAFRYKPVGTMFDVGGLSLFPREKEMLFYLIALCNTVYTRKILEIISPTLNCETGHVSSIPVIIQHKEQVIEKSKQNIDLCKVDWDSFETSWDFKRHPLVTFKGGAGYADIPMEKWSGTIESAFHAWQAEAEARFNQLKANEEELNRIFIDIYGLQDELTPEVEDRDVTVRKADLQREIKSLLSYAVGCMFGRYSLDVDGLAYAGGEWDPSKYVTFQPDPDNVIPITDEKYLDDDIVARLCDWLKVVYGEDTLEENLDYIAKALGKKGDTSREIIRNYFLTDFFKDHCSTYSVTGSGKRPIYWLFDSGKQNGFKALIYLHRYTPDTIGNLRIDYLHRMQKVYDNEIDRMQDMIDHSRDARETARATKRKEKLQKQKKECIEYDEKIAHLALSRIELDLDDGVKVNYEKIQTAKDGKKYPVLAKI